MSDSDIKKEAVYQAKIQPLMDEILGICKAHEIAMMSNFHLGGDVICATTNLGDETDPPMILLLIGGMLHVDLLAQEEEEVKA